MDSTLIKKQEMLKNVMKNAEVVLVDYTIIVLLANLD
jgi:hypothetical protein